MHRLPKSDILVKLVPTGLIEHKYHDSYHLSSKKETGLIDLFPVIGLEELLMHSTFVYVPHSLLKYATHFSDLPMNY